MVINEDNKKVIYVFEIQKHDLMYMYIRLQMNFIEHYILSLLLD